MKAEIIAIGTELLLGDVINTNATWLSKKLAAIGVDVYYHDVVGDNPARIKALVSEALERSDLLLFTGGLGPTDDDLTIETLAECFQTPLVSDPDSVESIRKIFQARKIPMPERNLKQALKPQGAKTLSNPLGTAPGILWQLKNMQKPLYIITFPGIPKELHVMWPQAMAFIQEAQRQAGETPSVIATRFLNFFGIGESSLIERFDQTPELKMLLEASNPTLAPYVGKSGEVRLRIAAKAGNEEEANTLIEPVKSKILAHCNDWYIGEDADDQTVSLETLVSKLLIEKGLSVSVAESCTGGLVSSRLTDVAGSSAYTMLNVVTYSNVQKHKLLGVSEESLANDGAVSETVARQMAEGVKRLSGCDIGLSLTGVAGPGGGSEDKPVGLVYIGICGQDGQSQARQVLVNPRHGRSDVKMLFSQHALNILRQHLQERYPSDKILDVACPANMRATLNMP